MPSARRTCGTPVLRFMNAAAFGRSPFTVSCVRGTTLMLAVFSFTSYQ